MFINKKDDYTIRIFNEYLEHLPRLIINNDIDNNINHMVGALHMIHHNFIHTRAEMKQFLNKYETLKWQSPISITEDT